MNGTNYEVPHCGAFSTPHSHPSWAQIFASGASEQNLIRHIHVLGNTLIYTPRMVLINGGVNNSNQFTAIEM